MAGSATTYAQNITVVGDFNAYVDPEALDIVVRSGARVTMVGLDQTSKVILTRDDADRMLASADPFSQWAGECTHAWIDYLARAFPKREEHTYGCFLHDPLVVAAHLDPRVCEWDAAHRPEDPGGAERDGRHGYRCRRIPSAVPLAYRPHPHPLARPGRLNEHSRRRHPTCDFTKA